MPTLKLNVDPETYQRLVECADRERRPLVWQAAVALRRAVGLPFPPEPDEGAEPAATVEVAR